MNITWYRSESDTKPDEVCLDWSPKHVYLHRNFEQVTHDLPTGKITAWEYDEAKLTNDEYHQYVVDNRLDDQQAQIDYTAMMTDTLL